MLKKRKIPMRMCVGCREMKPKAEMMRVVKPQDGDCAIDRTGKAPGRGAYICNKEECILRLKKQRLLNKAFSADVPLEVYVGIEEEFFAKR